MHRTTPSTPVPPSAALADIAKRLLVLEIGEQRASRDVATGAAQLCEKLARHIARLVGRHGIAALFGRSLLLTKKRFPWLPPAPAADAPADAQWIELRAALEGQAPEVALDAATSLTTTFVALLGTVIGDALVVRLLSEVWPEDSLDRRTEDTQ